MALIIFESNINQTIGPTGPIGPVGPTGPTGSGGSGSGNGLPAGGTFGQTIFNTGDGQGDWETLTVDKVLDVQELILGPDEFFVGTSTAPVARSKNQIQQLLNVDQVGVQLLLLGDISDGNYRLIYRAPFGMNITALGLELETGSLTASLQINGVPITGLDGLNINDTPTKVNATVVGSVILNDIVSLVITGATAAQNLSGSIWATRAPGTLGPSNNSQGQTIHYNEVSNHACPGGIAGAVFTEFPLYVPTTTNDVEMLSLELAAFSPIGRLQYTFKIYAGNPSAGGKLIYDAPGTYSQGISYSPAVLYIPFGSGSNEIWIQISNPQNPFTISTVVSVIEYDNSSAPVPPSPPSSPPPYTGPLLDTITVGINQPQFKELSDIFIDQFNVSGRAPNKLTTADCPNGTNVLTFADTTGIAVHNMVYQYDPAFVTLGDFGSWLPTIASDNIANGVHVIDVTATTVTLSANVTGDIPSGSKIQFYRTALADNGVINVESGGGVFYRPITIPPCYTNVTINGTGTFDSVNKTYASDATIFNGLGGDNAGYRLAGQKGFIHPNSPITVNHVAFVNCGSVLPQYVQFPQTDPFGNQACVYPESFRNGALPLVLNNCAFDNSTNGLNAPEWRINGHQYGIPGAVDSLGHTDLMMNALGYNVNIVIHKCDFGYLQPNGLNSGAMDTYLRNRTVTVTNTHFYGAFGSHSLRTRAETTTATDCWIRKGSDSAAGRCIETSNGGHLTVTNCDLIAPPGSGIAFIDYAPEYIKGQLDSGIYDTLFSNCRLHVGNYFAAIWNVEDSINGDVALKLNGNPATMTFDDACVIKLYKQNGIGTPLLSDYIMSFPTRREGPIVLPAGLPFGFGTPPTDTVYYEYNTIVVPGPASIT